LHARRNGRSGRLDGGRSLGLALVGGRLFEPPRHFHVILSYFEHPLLGARVFEGLGFDQDFLGVVSRLSRKR
jgi:hypothetical protein